MLRLEYLRKQKGLSQNELADKIGLTQQRISAYEKGIREPDIETLQLLSNFFNVSIDYMIGKTDKQIENKLNYDEELSKIGLSLKDMKTIDDDTKKEIKNFVEFIKGKNGNK